jgi:DNA polymerase-3 subunit delta
VTVHLLWGEDDFLLREAALELLGDVQPREVDASAWAGGELADLATPSLFGERRALLVTDCRALPDHAITELKVFLADPPEEAPLVLCVTVAERGKVPAGLSKLVSPVGEVREIRVTRRDLAGWLLGRAKASGVALTQDGAAALVETIGEDPAALAQALEQLSTAFPGERIAADLVHRQFRGLGEHHTWDLCDRAFKKDLVGAMRSLQALLGSRADSLMILGAIAARLRDLLRVRSLPERLSPREVVQQAGLRFDWQVRAYREQARRFDVDELVRLHLEVVEADRALKSGGSGDVVLPVLIASIAGTPVPV